MDRLNQSRLWELYMASVSAAMENGNAPEAEELLLKALGELTELLEKRKFLVIAAQHMLANLYKDQRRYAEAEPLYAMCLTMLQAGEGQADASFAELLKDYAMCVSEQGRIAEGMPLAQRALAVAAGRMPGNDPCLIEYLTLVAILGVTLKRFGDAEACLKQMLSIGGEETGGGDTLRAINDLVDLGRVYFQQEKFAEAEESYRRALLLWRAGSVGSEADVAACLNDLGLALCAQGRHGEAQPLCSEAISLREPATDAGDGDTVSTIADLADVYCSHCRFDDAARLCAQSFALRCGCNEGSDISSLLDSFGQALRRKGYAGAADRVEQNLVSDRDG